jgi:hypothetical protein
LGEFLPVGGVLTPNYWANCFLGDCTNFDKKNVLGYILGDFLKQTHPVTLLVTLAEVTNSYVRVSSLKKANAISGLIKPSH